MSRLSSVRSTRKRKDFHPSRDARLGDPGLGWSEAKPQVQIKDHY